jgi:hypothetical protein
LLIIKGDFAGFLLRRLTDREIKAREGGSESDDEFGRQTQR